MYINTRVDVRDVSSQYCIISHGWAQPQPAQTRRLLLAQKSVSASRRTLVLYQLQLLVDLTWISFHTHASVPNGGGSVVFSLFRETRRVTSAPLLLLLLSPCYLQHLRFHLDLDLDVDVDVAGTAGDGILAGGLGRVGLLVQRCHC